MEDDLYDIVQRMGENYIMRNILDYFHHGYLSTSARARSRDLAQEADVEQQLLDDSELGDDVTTKRRFRRRHPVGSRSSSSSPSYGGGTNNEVEGVEEGDVVQSDGINRVYIARDYDILVIDAATLTLLQTTELPPLVDTCHVEVIVSMLLMDTATRLVVFVIALCDGFTDDMLMDDTIPSYESPSQQLPVAPIQTMIYIYDTKDMTLHDTLIVPGETVQTRAINDTVHVYGTSRFHVRDIVEPLLDPWHIEQTVGSQFLGDDYRLHAKQQLDNIVKDYVADFVQTLDCANWKHQTYLSEDALDAGDSIHLMTVSSFRVSDKETPIQKTLKSTSIVLPNGYRNIYIGKKYSVLSSYNNCIMTGGCYKDELVSNVVVFKMNGPTVELWAVGTVLGGVTSASINIGKSGMEYLYITTTRLAEAGGNDDQGYHRAKFHNSVNVFEIQKGNLSMLGQVNDPGDIQDIIFPVRFVGDHGFLAFQSITSDPFYGMNLTDPTNPELSEPFVLSGELSYIFPLSDHLLLGVGGIGETNGYNVQLALIDATNLDRPSLIHQWVEPYVNGTIYTDVEYDFRSFRYIEDGQLVIIPVLEQWAVPCYENNDSCTVFEGFHVFQMNAKTGISKYLSINHLMPDEDSCSLKMPPLESRSVVVGDALLTVEGYTIQLHNITSKSEIAPQIDLCHGVRRNKDT